MENWVSCAAPPVLESPVGVTRGFQQISPEHPDIRVLELRSPRKVADPEPRAG